METNLHKYVITYRDGSKDIIVNTPEFVTEQLNTGLILKASEIAVNKTKISKKTIAELRDIVSKHGYWSSETRVFIGHFDYSLAKKLHLMAQTYEKYGYGL